MNCMQRFVVIIFYDFYFSLSPPFAKKVILSRVAGNLNPNCEIVDWGR